MNEDRVLDRRVRMGFNPYEFVGPGRTFDFPDPLFYPLPALMFALPLTWLPLEWADAVFIGVSVGLFVWAVQRSPATSHATFALVSIAGLIAIVAVQWSPLITAAALIPSLGALLICKPTIGAALWLAYPNWRALVIGGALTLLTIAVWPWWVRSWFEAVRSNHASAMLLFAGGPLLLAALWKWRLPEARLLVALACLPHTPALYEAIPLFLIPRTLGEAGLLSLGTLWVLMIRLWAEPHTADGALWITGQAMIVLLYLPCLVMILRREE